MDSLFKSLIWVKSPLNYTGGKFKLLPQILPHFPQDIDTFVDMFAGGCNVGVNAPANNIICNDIIPYLIDIFNLFKQNPKADILDKINSRISEFKLDAYNEDAYTKFRDYYNSNPNPLDLYILVAHSFNYQIRFNSKHKYNNPFGKTNSTFNNAMKKNLSLFIDKLKETNIQFITHDFIELDLSTLTQSDFVYCDPPYLITTGAYNDGKRGFKGWSTIEEKQLLNLLESLNEKGIRFALSNVFYHKGKSNEILISWVEKHNFRVEHLKKNYAASSYHTLDRSKNGSDEVLIMNY